MFGFRAAWHALSTPHTQWQVFDCLSDTHLIPLSDQCLRSGHILGHGIPGLALWDAQLEGHVLHPVLHLPQIVVEGRDGPEDA